MSNKSTNTKIKHEVEAYVWDFLLRHTESKMKSRVYRMFNRQLISSLRFNSFTSVKRQVREMEKYAQYN